MNTYMKRLTQTCTAYSGQNRALAGERRMELVSEEPDTISLIIIAVESVPVGWREDGTPDENVRQDVEIGDIKVVLTRDGARELVEKLHGWFGTLAP